MAGVVMPYVTHRVQRYRRRRPRVWPYLVSAVVVAAAVLVGALLVAL